MTHASATPQLVPVILAGGKGERFWPLSRKLRPKQFLSLDGSGQSLLQSTAERLKPIAGGWDNLWVVTAAHLADGVRQQLPELPEANLLVEPEGRDTAPAVAWSSLAVADRYGHDAVVGFFPADHWIADEAAFNNTLAAAAQLALAEDAIATIGIAPTFPSSGYGYIQAGEALDKYQNCPSFRVARFTEKPDRETAEAFLATGQFSWNSGMFVFRAGLVIDELRQHAPEILNPLEAEGVNAYPSLVKQSIDYALMEKTSRACVIPAQFGWDDLGDWNAIERLMKSDAPNVELGTHVGLDTQGSLFYTSDAEEVIVTIGLEDLVVVRDGKVTLLAHKDRTQEIKQVLKQIQAQHSHLL
jgi:mannose-1-phosphate guanylyltransferase